MPYDWEERIADSGAEFLGYENNPKLDKQIRNAFFKAEEVIAFYDLVLYEQFFFVGKHLAEKIIKTERLILREMTGDDFDALYRSLAEPEVMQNYPDTFDEVGVRNWIVRNMERYRIFGFGLWAVCLKETGEMIGDCGLTMQLIGGQIKPEIGYHIRADHQRKGYGAEAAIAVRDWTVCNTPFNIVYSYMKYTNDPSARTAMAYGCKQVDEFADEVNEITKVFAISREEWAKR